MNKGNGVFEDKPLELSPTVSKNMAHFGHVVARIGDIDQDGFEGKVHNVRVGRCTNNNNFHKLRKLYRVFIKI